MLLVLYLLPPLVDDVVLDPDELPAELPDETEDPDELEPDEDLPELTDPPDEPEDIEPEDIDPEEDLPELTELPPPMLPVLIERPVDMELEPDEDDPSYLPLLTGTETLLLPLLTGTETLLLPLLTGVLTLLCVELWGIDLLTEVPDEVLVLPPVLLLLIVLFTLLLFCTADEFELFVPGNTVVLERLVLYDGRVVTLGLL